MALLAVSDLHIEGPDDPWYGALVRWLDEVVGAGDTVVLGGDLFDLWVGDKAVFRDRYAAFLEALGRLGERRVRVHYIEGNHDFLLARALRRLPHVRVHARAVEIRLGGRRFFCAHGDLVDRGDVGYLALRTLLRSPLMRAFVAGAPGRWIDGIGRRSSAASRGARDRRRLADRAAAAETAARESERFVRLRTVYRNFAVTKLQGGFDFVVLGHCHDRDEMVFKIGGRDGHYMNVGFPRVHGSYVVWRPGDTRLSREALPCGS